MRRTALWGQRLGTAALAAIAAVTVLGAALVPRYGRTDDVWEWDDIARARVALVLGLISVLGGIAVAASPWRERPVPTGRLLAAQLLLTVFAVACALVVLRSGAWLDHMQSVPLP
jgi:hypothetical protein